MGKRAERKSRAAAAKQKQAAARAPKSVLQQSKPVESTDDGVPVMKERKPCPHLDKGIDSDKISVKIGSSDPIRCEDCREGVGDRRGKKGKGKHGKKKGSSLVDSKSDSKAIWVCLGCGHYACGGVGLPTTPQSHVVRHARQTRHPLVIQWENPHLRWCFPCNTLIPVEKMEENGENKDALSEVVKLIKGRSTESSLVDVEDAWFGSGNIDSEIKSESTVVSGSDLDGNACYVVRGLANLGNTCFFNSVMQNLLAMSQLRDYFLNAELTFGPLTIALKKLFAETKPETGLRNVINPRSFFGCICSKAPQFKGYQQHDSHELLRCLLDGLCSEELAFRKRNSPSEENGISSNQGPVFVDYVFGGQIASTVRCVECGHSSTVYEPFLDLSLPVPTKKAPSKKTQPASRAKKTKLPPKKSGRIRSKGTKDTHAVTTQSISNLSISSKSQSLTESTAPLSENVVSSSGGSQLLDSVGSCTVATQCGSALQNVPADPLPQHDQVIDIPVEQTVASLDDFWLDYIEPQTTGDVLDSTWQKSDVSVIQDSTDFAWLDYIEPETISDAHGLTLQNNDVLFVQDSGGSQLLDSVGSRTVATQCGSALQNVPADPLPQHDQVIDIPVEQTVASLDDFWLDYVEPQTTGDVLDSTWQKSDVSVIQDSKDFAWLDYIEPETISDEHGLTLQNNDVLFVQDSGGSQLLDSVGSPTVATQCGSALQNVPADPLAQHDQVIDIPVEQTVASLDDFWLDYIEPQTTGDVLDSTWQKSDVSVIQDSTDFAWLDYIEPETISDEHGLTVQNNDVLFVQDSGEKDEVSDDSLINSNQIPLVDSKPNLKADSSSGDAGEDELPLVVQESEVILLPYNEEISTTAENVSEEGEASSSVVGCRQEEVDFDGFGDLFNEPETAIGPVPRPSSGTESVGSGFVVGNSSDSDPDEVDDSDSPVSVESCLVHFIKPELLTDDNAWDCESCSKTLQRQKLEALKRRAKLASKPLINGGETSNRNDIQGSSLTDVDSLCNGDTKTNNDLNTFCESLVSQSGKIDCFNQDCAEVESGLTNDVNPAVPQRGKGKMKINDAVEMQSCSQESITDQDEGSCSVDGATSSGYSAEKVYQSDSLLVAGNCESEESKVEETNSKIVKVKRDATKRVLINKAPPILTIHLKRFSQDARGRLSKLNGHVNFSEIINLRPYMDPGCTDHDNYDYRLVGVVEHLGTMRAGHYVAYVRGGPKNKVKAKKESVGGVWYHASDVYVREVSLEEVLRCEAYILFYEKI